MSIADICGKEASIRDFLEQHRGGLLNSLDDRLPPLFDEGDQSLRGHYQKLAEELKRPPFDAQFRASTALTELLTTHRSPASILYGEMGCGKTMMAITVLHFLYRMKAGAKISMVVCPPHLVYKWRREIMATLPDAEVLVLNGSDTIKKLLRLRDRWLAGDLRTLNKPYVIVLGRVRMRLGFYWHGVTNARNVILDDGEGRKVAREYLSCPDCRAVLTDPDGAPYPCSNQKEEKTFNEKRLSCKECGSRLWTMRRRTQNRPLHEVVKRCLLELPTIGKMKADNLIEMLGEENLARSLENNVHDLINGLDEDGNFLFTDKQSQRIERHLGKTEFSIKGGGDYQATEWIKRYFPQGFIDLLIVDEGHELKGGQSAQGQAFGTLASSCNKRLLLTGTLMGGYASDLFYLLWRLNPTSMVEQGFGYGKGGTLGGAESLFMRRVGVVKDIYVSKGRDDTDFRTSKGSRGISHRTAEAPGFSPEGVMRYLVPVTAFVRMGDIGGSVLPTYTEEYVGIEMAKKQRKAYDTLAKCLAKHLKEALARKDRTLLGLVLQTTLAWPDCAFRDEVCRHPRTRSEIIKVPAVFDSTTCSPKEDAIIAHVKQEKEAGRRVLLYTIYSGTRDTTTRWKSLLEREGLRVGVLRASVKTDKREDWVLTAVERGIDVLVCNPELVKTGLDLLDFPTIIFANTGYSVYTLQQASRRSWRIGQKLPVRVYFYGYTESAQTSCLDLMSQKIGVAQSTSGEMPATGLDVLNSAGESMEIELAKMLVSQQQLF